MGATVLGFAIYFFMASRRFLQQYLPSQPRKAPATASSQPSASSPSTPAAPKEKAGKGKQKDSNYVDDRMQHYKQNGWTVYGTEPKKELPKDELIDTLRTTISQQQKTLNGFLLEIEGLQDGGKKQLEEENHTLQETIKNLELKLKQKDIDAEGLRQQASMAHELNQRIEEVYEEFRQMQKKLSGMEQQAARANILELELEEVRDAYERIHNDAAHRQEKLEETLAETRQLRHQLKETEEKLAEANRQRQQLHKKVQFLTDMNDDLHKMSDTNKKLQNELRRIGELESMLNMISEERDQLLKRRSE
jgi:chromosome segregation ATPase